MSANERFDLDRDGTTDVPGPGDPGCDFNGACPPCPPCPTPPCNPCYFPRRDFSWQWYVVNAVNAEDLVGYKKEGIRKDKEKEENLSVDVDEDLNEEQIIRFSDHAGIIMRVVVIDNQEGDIDTGADNFVNGKQVGLLSTGDIFTVTNEGHFLKIEEGKLYNTADQFVRSVQKKDQIDTITRYFQLTKNTGRFCLKNSSGPPSAPDYNRPGGAAGPYNIDENGDGTVGSDENESNPVDVCGSEADCKINYPNNTCMDIMTDPNMPLLYIRSKPVDRRGRKWITNIKDDPYINFVVPGI